MQTEATPVGKANGGSLVDLVHKHYIKMEGNLIPNNSIMTYTEKITKTK
jgi:hypothetical protein